ncbi:MAG TPA: hypothetical protein VFI68_06105 [Anaerolineales bacterium]|nr:hypothetical protein [Anaerolineales bacterium]
MNGKSTPVKYPLGCLTFIAKASSAADGWDPQRSCAGMGDGRADCSLAQSPPYTSIFPWACATFGRLASRFFLLPSRVHTRHSPQGKFAIPLGYASGTMTQTVGRLKNKSNFMKRYSLTQIPTDCKVIGGLPELK